MHRQEINEYPEELKAEALRLSDWIRATRAEYGPQVVIRMVDPQSLLGIWRALRFRVRRYPTFLIDGRERVVGWDGDPAHALASAIERRRIAPAGTAA